MEAVSKLLHLDSAEVWHDCDTVGKKSMNTYTLYIKCTLYMYHPLWWAWYHRDPNRKQPNWHIFTPSSSHTRCSLLRIKVPQLVCKDSCNINQWTVKEHLSRKTVSHSRFQAWYLGCEGSCETPNMTFNHTKQTSLSAVMTASYTRPFLKWCRRGRVVFLSSPRAGEPGY